MKGIKYCVECGYYNIKKDKCELGARKSCTEFPFLEIPEDCQLEDVEEVKRSRFVPGRAKKCVIYLKTCERCRNDVPVRPFCCECGAKMDLED